MAAGATMPSSARLAPPLPCNSDAGLREPVEASLPMLRPVGTGLRSDRLEREAVPDSGLGRVRRCPVAAAIRADEKRRLGTARVEPSGLGGGDDSDRDDDRCRNQDGDESHRRSVGADGTIRLSTPDHSRDITEREYLIAAFEPQPSPDDHDLRALVAAGRPGHSRSMRITCGVSAMCPSPTTAAIAARIARSGVGWVIEGHRHGCRRCGAAAGRTRALDDALERDALGRHPHRDGGGGAGAIVQRQAGCSSRPRGCRSRRAAAASARPSAGRTAASCRRAPHRRGRRPRPRPSPRRRLRGPASVSSRTASAFHHHRVGDVHDLGDGGGLRHHRGVDTLLDARAGALGDRRAA